MTSSEPLASTQALSATLTGQSWVADGLTVEGSLSALDATLRPIDALSAANMDWLTAKVQPLQDRLDHLAGNSSAIQSFADAAQRTADTINEIQQQLTSQATAGQWQGSAADGYRNSATQISLALQATATLYSATSTVTTTMGGIVAGARTQVNALLTDLVQQLISYVQQGTAADGGLSPNVMAQATQMINAYATPIADIERKLLQTIQNLQPHLTGDGSDGPASDAGAAPDPDKPVVQLAFYDGRSAGEILKEAPEVLKATPKNPWLLGAAAVAIVFAAVAAWLLYEKPKPPPPPDPKQPHVPLSLPEGTPPPTVPPPGDPKPSTPPGAPPTQQPGDPPPGTHPDKPPDPGTLPQTAPPGTPPITSPATPPIQQPATAPESAPATGTPPLVVPPTGTPPQTEPQNNPPGTPQATPPQTPEQGPATTMGDEPPPKAEPAPEPDSPKPDANPEPGADSKPTDDTPTTGEPVDVSTGVMIQSQTDIALPGVLSLVIARTHKSSYRVGRWFGRSWASTLDQKIWVEDDAVYFAADDGMLLKYPLPSDTTPVLPVEGAPYPLARDADGGYTVTNRRLGQTTYFAPNGRRRRPITAITDRTGNRIDFEYDRHGVISGVRHSGGYRIGVHTRDGLITELRLSDPDVVITRYEYNDRRQLVAVINSSGLPMRFDYDDNGRMTRWEDRNGMWYRYTYDADGRCVRGEGKDGCFSYTFAYDRDNLVTRATDSLGHTTTYQLNDRLQVVAETDPLGNTTLSEWDARHRLLARTDPLGRTTRFAYDEHGNLITVTPPAGNPTRTAYDAFGLPTTVVQADSGVWRQNFDATGNRIAVTDPAGATTRYAYRDHGCLASVTDPTGATWQVHTDAAGLALAVAGPDGATTRYRRDAFGRTVEVTDPVGGVTALAWTTEGQLAARTLPDGATDTWAYDGEGNLVRHTDPAGNVTRTEYAHLDVPTARTGPDGARLAFRYDSELRLTEVVNPQGLTWRYRYDPAGRLTSETDFNDRLLRYGYDRAGQLVSRVNGAGQVVRYEYDALGRMTEREADGATTTFAHDPLGRLAHAAGPDATLAYQRDPVGRVIAETVNGHTVRSTYDAAGRRVRRMTPSGSDSEWSYDLAGNLVGVTTAGRSLGFQRDGAGREIRRQFGATVLDQNWDANHRLVGQTLHAAGQHDRPRPAQWRRYTYRDDGYLLGVDDLLGGARRFSLDPAGRVTDVRGAGWAEHYAYDSAGNVTDASWPPAGPAVGTREYRGTLITRAGATRYRHDAQGRVVVRQRTRLSHKPETWHYTWNAEDQLVGVVTPDGQRWRYRYDPLGRRIAKQQVGADGTTVVARVDFTWDDTTLAEQATWDARQPAATVTTWEHDGARPISQTDRTHWPHAAQQQVDERFYAIVTDLVGAPSELVDESGTVAWRSQATLWGENAASTGTPLRFPGQYFDPETGFNYNFFRHYDPETARYASLDPLGLAPAPNPSTYVRNPHTLSDRLGLAPDCAVIGRLPDTAPYIGKPGYDVLNDPKWTIDKNDQWVQSIIDRNGKVLVASPLTPDNLWDSVRNRETVFARELKQLQNAGYGPFPPAKGDILSPPPPSGGP